MTIKNSIRNRLVTALACLAIVPLLLLAVALYWQNIVLQTEQVKDLQKGLTVQASQNVAFYLQEQQNKILTLVKANYLPEMSRERQTTVLSRFLTSSKDESHGYVFRGVTLLDDTGKELVNVSRTWPKRDKGQGDWSRSEEFRVPFQSGGIYQSPVYFDELTGEPLLRTGHPIRELRTEKISGVLVVEMNLKFVRDVVAGMRVGKSGSAFIVNHNGLVVAHPNPAVVFRKTHFDLPEEPAIMPGVEGEKSVVAAERINFGNTSLFLVTEIPVNEALRHVNRSVFTLGVFLLFSLAGAVALGVVLVRQIIRPIEALADTARTITGGDFSHKAELSRTDEFGDLAAAFNTMTSRLVETITALEQEKNFVKDVIESLSHPFYVIDVKDYTIKLANSAADFGPLTKESTCYRLTHHSDGPCTGDDHPCVIKEIIKTKKSLVVEHVHQARDLSSKTMNYEVYGYPIFDDNGEVAQVIEYNIDISEKKNLEEQLRQAQKLEAIGSLAGGVAHDFNNLLTPILGYSELALEHLSEEDPLREQLQSVYSAGERAAALTRQLLAFSRKQVMELRVINLNTLINNMAKMLGRLIGEHIEIKLLLQTTLGNIRADPGQIEQIIMNLAVNARDAMPTGGSLTFATETIELDEGYCRHHAEVVPGTYVVLSVTDTGQGVPPDLKEKIFDPFFTTKTKSGGTGLGLSTVYGIVKQHKGNIYVYSEVGGGTRFKIFFPAVDEVTEEVLVGGRQALLRGTETILVVDDESAIRNMVSDTLRSLGYQALEAASGEEALEMYITTGRSIDLLLTDVVMPGMSGRQLAEALEDVRPDMRVLFMSGYTDNVIAHQGILGSDVSFINKPLIPSLLVKKIREILDNDPRKKKKVPGRPA